MVLSLYYREGYELPVAVELYEQQRGSLRKKREPWNARTSSLCEFKDKPKILFVDDVIIATME